MPDHGDVVTLDFPGATGRKRRPAVAVSSALYHAHRPDIVVGLLTTNLAAAGTPLDHLLRDWQAAGLQRPSAFRAYFATVEQGDVHVIGRLPQHDWEAIRGCAARALGLEVRAA